MSRQGLALRIQGYDREDEGVAGMPVTAKQAFLDCMGGGTTKRCLLVAALIDEGWDIRRNYIEGTIEGYGSGGAVEWTGTIADMPQEIYNELRGRLK